MQESTAMRPTRTVVGPPSLIRERPMRTTDEMARRQPKISVRHLNFYYGPKQALTDVSLEIPEHCVTAFIGPSGCGKSTFLRCLNRMNDLVDGARIEGKILYSGTDLYGDGVDPIEVR